MSDFIDWLDRKKKQNASRRLSSLMDEADAILKQLLLRDPKMSMKAAAKEAMKQAVENRKKR